MQDSQKEARSARREVHSAQEWAEPPHTGAATGCEAAAVAQDLTRALPVAHWRWIYGSRACGSRCLPKGGVLGCRRHKPSVLGPWTRSMQSPGPCTTAAQAHLNHHIQIIHSFSQGF